MGEGEFKGKRGYASMARPFYFIIHTNAQLTSMTSEATKDVN